MKKIIALLIIIVTASTLKAQTDSLKIDKEQPQKTFLKAQYIPFGLMGIGSLLNIGTIKNHIEKVIPDTHTRIDNYLQFTPVAQLYVYDFLGVKHRNDVFTQTKYLVMSQLTSGLLVQSLKGITRVERPRGGNTSFPSGHTTNAFVNATILYKEFKDTSPWLAYSGFAVATTTGILRMTNDAHWLPDVLTGAGIGILTVNLVYYFEPLKNFNPFNKPQNISLIPQINSNNYGLYFSYKF